MSEQLSGLSGIEELEAAVRLAAFNFLRTQNRVHGELLPRDVLVRGFEFDGERVPLVAPNGIFKPRLLKIPLSITTAPPVVGHPRPYDDAMESRGRLVYRYRGTDVDHPDNVGLRRAMRQQVPLVYFHGLVPGWYFAVFPVYVVGDDPKTLAFKVAADEHTTEGVVLALADDDRRRYVTQLMQQRMHQADFRARVLRAYQVRCAICRLHDHPQLLDAAHILPDGHPQGRPVVPNGLSLCKLHHAAFDANLIGIRPDRVIEIRPDLLAEEDGPMLIHGLKGFDRQRIVVPGKPDLKPDPEFLEERYELFREAS